MAKEIIIQGTNLLESLADAWGGVNNTGADITPYSERGATTVVPDGYKWGMNFAEVERFIKSQFGDKVGHFVMENINGVNYLLGFDSIETYQAWSADNSDPDNQPIVTAEMETHERYIARVASSSDPADEVVTNQSSFNVGIRFTALQYEGGEYVNSGLSGILTFLRSVDDGVTFNEVGKVNIVSRDENSSSFDQIDIGPYLRDGYKNIIAVVASFNAGGATYTSRRVPVATVTYTSLSLECMSDWYNAIQSSDIVDNGLRLSYKGSYAVNAVLHITVTGSRQDMVTTHLLEAGTSGTQQQFALFDSQGLYGLKTHGVRKVTAWLSCDDGMGGTLEGNRLENRFMVIDADTAGANADKPYLMIQDVVNSVENFVQTKIMGYAVYNPAGNEAVPLSIAVTDEADEYPAGEYETWFSTQQNAVPGMDYDLVTSIDIEDDGSTPFFRAYLRIFSGDDNILQRSLGGAYWAITVDNSNSFSPKAGASFILNPKARNNDEPNPESIINARSGAEVQSTWTGFGGGAFDRWIKAEDGFRVLRVLAGQRLNIQYNPFAQFVSAPNSSMTLEFDLKVRNVTNEDTPIIAIGETVAGDKRGLFIKPISGNLFTKNEPNDSETNFRWQEGVRTHIVVNIHNAVQTDVRGDGLVTDDYYAEQGSPSTTRMFARVFINGDIERELLLAGTDADEFCTALMSNGGITIGQDGADIDIYSIRCYERQYLDAQDIVRNYVASLPTAAEKLKTRAENDIMRNGRVDVERVKALGKRVLILHGKEPYKMDTSASGNWWEIFQYDGDGNLIPELSGTICKATGISEVKRQGSTANTYYYSNLQTKVDDANGTIDVPVSDIHESMTVGEPYEKNGVMVVDIYGGNLGKSDPWAQEPKQYPYNDGVVTVPDGWVDGNGKYRGKGFMITEGTPLALKLVLKINYASSMQSHVVGGTRLFNDLHRAIVGDNEMQQVVSTARVSKYTEPVFFFTQLDENSDVVFRGMGNFGAGKMDKPTWGYVKSKHPMFAMVEGADNDLALTDFRVPFITDPECDECAVYDPEEEGWIYNGLQCLDFDGGKTDDDGYPVQALIDRIAETWNWVYLHSPNIKVYNGSFESFMQSDKAADHTSKYWCTRGAEAFRLKRFNETGDGTWVDAGLWNNGSYGVIDLRTDPVTKPAYDIYSDPSAQMSLSELNELFKAKIVADAKKYIGRYFKVDSLKFHYAFVNHFMAGTDNCSKNTYFVLMPVATPVTIDGVTENCYLWELHQDDVDTILITDNNGRSTKPYYIDRMHPYSDDNPGESCYMGGHNQLFNLCEEMWEGDGDNSKIAEMLRRIFTAMVGLVSDADVIDGYSKTVLGCMEKYMLYSQHYFPQMAYNEQARIRYEFPATLGYISSGKGERHIPPITQSMGSQLQAETQFIKRRLVYMASYAAWGEFSGDNNYRSGVAETSATFGFEPTALPNGQTMDYGFDLTPHMYIYPSGALGQTAVCPRHRVAPGETWRLRIGRPGTGDTGVSLFAINFYRKIGNVGDMSVNPNNSATANGNRLTEFVAEPTTQYEVDGRTVGAYRPNRINVTALLLRTVSLHGSGIGGQLDLRSQARLEEIDLGGTYIINVQLPQTKRLTDLVLPNSLATLAIDGQPNLENVSFDSPSGYSLETIRILGNTNLADFTRSLVLTVLDEGGLNTLTLDNVDWTGENAIPAASFSQLLEVPNVNIEGTIEVTGEVTAAMALRLVSKFPWLYDEDSPLTVTYSEVPLSSAAIKCSDYGVNGDYLGEEGDYQLGIVPTPSSANNIHKVVWSLSMGSSAGAASINQDGVLHVESLNTTNQNKITVTATITTSTGTVTATRSIALYAHEAAIGDLVFSDGSYSNTILAGKSPVAACFYIDPDNPNNRLAVALQDLSQGPWGLYNNNQMTDSNNGIPNVKLDIEASDTSDAAKYRCYNVAALPNYPQPGIQGTITASNYTDANEPDGFKKFTPLNQALADIGFITLENQVGRYAAGETISAGQFNTQVILLHRNMVLEGVTIQGFNRYSYYPFNVVSGTPEMTQLQTAINAIVAAKGNLYRQFFWPAASQCDAYEPTVRTDLGEVLDDKFKAHNWALPSAGELGRIYYWDKIDQTGKFNLAKSVDGRFATMIAQYYWSSTEHGGPNDIHSSWAVRGSDGWVKVNIKFYTGNQVRAVVAF